MSITEGRIIGTYQIEKLVASYASGKVYQAQDLICNRERVFLHCLALSQPTAGEITDLEVRLGALAFMRHPHILPVLNFFFADEEYWVVTQYIAGMAVAGSLSVKDVHKNWLSQAGEILDYLCSFYSGYAHGSLSKDSFRLGFDNNLYLIELGWLTGSFGSNEAMKKDMADLEPMGLRQYSTLFKQEFPRGSAKNTNKYSGCCPECKKLLRDVRYCPDCGFDVSTLVPVKLPMLLNNLAKSTQVELFSLEQLYQSAAYNWCELEAAITDGSLSKWLRAMNEEELAGRLERGLVSREKPSYLLAQLLRNISDGVRGRFRYSPVKVELGINDREMSIVLEHDDGYVYGKVLNQGSDKGVAVAPKVFGGQQVEIDLRLDRIDLAPGRHRVLVPLEVNGQREFIPIFFHIDGTGAKAAP